MQRKVLKSSYHSTLGTVMQIAKNASIIFEISNMPQWWKKWSVIGGAKMCQIVTKQLYYSLFPTLRMTFYLFDIINEKILCEKIIDCQIDM